VPLTNETKDPCNFTFKLFVSSEQVIAKLTQTFLGRQPIRIIVRQEVTGWEMPSDFHFQ